MKKPSVLLLIIVSAALLVACGADIDRTVTFYQDEEWKAEMSPGNCGRRTQASASLAGTYGLAAGYQVADFEDLTNQELNGEGTNWLDEQGVPSIAVLLRDYLTTDWQENLAGMQAVLAAHAD